MTLFLIHTQNLPVFQQLELEEALLRASFHNFCLINEGSAPAIVMGISGKVAELVDIEKTKEDNIPLIKRYSGGGTVIVDEQTLFVSFLFQKDLHHFPAYPEPIMSWSETIYRPVFGPLDFRLRENDYVIGDKKCGGNAQYIKKERWLHHTSFLWDYNDASMSYLLHPKKTPSYRMMRKHTDFLCRMKDFFPSKASFISKLKEELGRHFPVREISVQEAWALVDKPYRKTSVLISLQDYVNSPV